MNISHQTGQGFAGRTRQVQALLHVSCLLFTVFAGSGCTSLMNRPPVYSAPDNNVVLGAGDVIDIKFFYSPELNDHQTVRPDGMISLQLVGEITAEGMTPDRLRSVLVAKYSHLIEKPEVAVIVRRLVSRSVYVSGAVVRPGKIDMEGRLTALQAVMHAGGFNPVTAKSDSVIVVRHTSAGHRGYKLDLKSPLAGTSQNAFYLHPQDIVYVPRTRIVHVNQWIDQYINNIVPQLGVRVSTIDDKTTYTIDTTDFRR